MATEKEGLPSSGSPAAQVEGEPHPLTRLDTKGGIHEFREDEGYVLDPQQQQPFQSDNEAGGVKLAADGHTRLIPQPSDDPNDPLNWSWRKKHMILFVVAAAAFLPDYSSASGAVTLGLQAA